MTDPVILSFDTSGPHCAAALLRGETVLAHRFEEMARGQAERLFPLLEEVLAEGQASWRDLTAIGVGIGPGNFTGIRISVSAARGLALSLDIPAIGVSTLKAQRFGTDGVVVSSVQAGRSGLYVEVFDGGGQTPLHCTLDSLPAMRDGVQPTCIGAMAAEIADKYAGRTANPAYPLAISIARVAGPRLALDNPPPAPLYLKAADAAPSRDAPPVILS